MKTSWQMSGVDPTWPFDPLVIRPAEGGILAPVSDATPYGAAVRCYLGVFDALIDAMALFLQTDTIYEALRVSDAGWEAVVDGDKQKPVVIHIGWRAKDYRLLQQPDGRFAEVGYFQHARPAGPKLGVEIWAFARRQQMFEAAGLYAWREFNKAVAARSDRSVATHALDAVRCADRDICTDVTEYNQVAMFDVEACEWHFVSRDGFAWEL